MQLEQPEREVESPGLIAAGPKGSYIDNLNERGVFPEEIDQAGAHRFQV
jgi:hypothetical protein